MMGGFDHFQEMWNASLIVSRFMTKHEFVTNWLITKQRSTIYNAPQLNYSLQLYNELGLNKWFMINMWPTIEFFIGNWMVNHD